MQSTKLALSLLAVLFLQGLQPPVQAQITPANDGTGTISPQQATPLTSRVERPPGAIYFIASQILD